MNLDTIIIEQSHCPLWMNAWEARRKSYEPPMPIGYGPTPKAALFELLEAEAEARGRRSGFPIRGNWPSNSREVCWQDRRTLRPTGSKAR